MSRAEGIGLQVRKTSFYSSLLQDGHAISSMWRMVLFTQGELDVKYMHHWAKQLGVEQQLASALAKKPNERP